MTGNGRENYYMAKGRLTGALKSASTSPTKATATASLEKVGCSVNPGLRLFRRLIFSVIDSTSRSSNANDIGLGETGFFRR